MRRFMLVYGEAGICQWEGYDSILPVLNEAKGGEWKFGKIL
jgi:hypothetical protein